MKENIHPNYHEITVIMTDGTSFKTRTTWGKAGDTMRLDIDPKSHPAWTGQHREVVKGGRMAKFKERFGALGSSKGGETSDAPAAKTAAKKPVEAKAADKTDKAADKPEAAAKKTAKKK